MFQIVTIIALLLVAATLGAAVVLVSLRAVEMGRKLKAEEEKAAAAQQELAATKRRLGDAEPATFAMTRRVEEADAAMNALRKQLEAAREEDQKKTGWLDHQQEEIDWLRAELEKRPKVTRKTYKIITLGVKWTGKTSLTLKWANPLIDLGTLQGTKIERYERTVSHVVMKDITTEHVFEIGDWGGEHIVDAQQELIMDEIHGMLIVVDLGGKDAKAVESARIQEQLREFQTESLKFFFSPKTVASCKTVVLFINKSDLIPGTPAEVEQRARELYKRLIDDLMKYNEKVDIRVFVGSANYGHSTHLLFSHFVEKILPKNAYDNQLLQRMKAEVPPARPQPKALPAQPPAAAQPPQQRQAQYAPTEPPPPVGPKVTPYPAAGELGHPPIQAKGR